MPSTPRRRPSPIARYPFATGALFAAALLAGCGEKAKGGAGKGKQAPLVTLVSPQPHLFVDRIEAVGTARANEQVTLASPVTERIERLYFEDGGFVRRGQIVAVLAQAEERAALAGAQADEAQVRAQLGRIQSLTDKGFATTATLEQQVAAAQRARSQADNARAQIADRVIRAPFSGYASLRTISAGAIVSSGAPIATISDVSRIKLDFSVPETALTTVKTGQSIVAVAAAYPDQPFSGTIQTIDPVIDPSTRAASIRAILPNPGNRLKPGMLLTVSISAASRRGLAVPELAVIGDGAERYVFVVGKDDKAVRTKVQVGLRDNGLIEVRGLPAGVKVIGEGVVKVTDGVTVRTQTAKAAAS
jgi:membrane fusion protein (multidrug efflux system)